MDESDTQDPDWVFNFLIYHSKNILKKDGDGYDLKTLRKTFRINYANILKWMHALGKNKIRKKLCAITNFSEDKRPLLTTSLK